MVERPRIHAVYQAKAATRQNRSNNQITQLVLHTPEGHEAGTLAVLQNGRAGFDWYLPPSGNLYKCNAFAKYIAWQAGYWPSNLRSIGIEQYNFAANMGNAPDAHYDRLADLVAWLTQLLDIPVRHANWDQPGLVAHAQITPNSRTDPGKDFDWERLISKVKAKHSGGPKPPTQPQGASSTGAPEKEIDLQRVNFLALGEKDQEIAKAARQALNQIARERGMEEYFARSVHGKAQARYAAREAWESTGDYRRTVVVGGPVFKELPSDVAEVLAEYPDRGNLLEAVGAGYNNTKVRALWRLISIADDLGFGYTEKMKVRGLYIQRTKLSEDTAGTGADLEALMGKASGGGNSPSKGPDTNATAPRTRFTKRISYSVWGRRAQAAARELYGLFGKQHSFVSLHTYRKHDGDPAGAIKRGTSQSLDFYVTGFGKEPNAEQERVLQQAVDHAVRNWSRLGLDKIIANRRYTRDGQNWYPYKWWTFKYAWGKLTKRVTKDHRDHGHFRFGNWR